MKVRELELFKACYCGLCHALRKKYGVAARFILSYELVFLAMLLWEQSSSPPELCRGRCIASPLRKKRYCARSAALDTCAGYSVILTWWKLKDNIADEPFIKAMPYRLALFLLSGAYKKASREFPAFDSAAGRELGALTEYESRRERSIDGAADKFAQILKAAAPEALPNEVRRPILELLYHLGRWIYIIDACDDYSGDVSAGRFNPVAAKYPPEGGRLPDDGAGRVKTTLAHSNNLIGASFELLPKNFWTDIAGNMIYLGMPEVCALVLEGRWPPRRRKSKKDKDWI